MFQTAFTAPSAQAAHTGISLLEDGASAIEAMVAAAATIAVSYPHMNSLGGDGFWLILPAEGDPVGILAGGTSGAAVDAHCWEDEQPTRGAASMLTLAGAVAGWNSALQWHVERHGAQRPLAGLLADAISLARDGCPASRSLVENLAEKRGELENLPGFSELFLSGGMPKEGDPIRNPDLAALLEKLCANGLDDFYRGDTAARIAAGFEQVGARLTAEDLAGYRARRVAPLALQLGADTVYNLPAPTQGVASLLIVGLFDRLRASARNNADHVHLLIEATKCAFQVRDAEIGDPETTSLDYEEVLGEGGIERLASRIDPRRAEPWPRAGTHSDTIWMGATDRFGNMVSYIQSLYWEFGSGVVLPETGMLWTNRGLCFDKAPGGPNAIGPGKIPRHTLNPAAARFGDGRRMVYGTMGGEGQPQTQGALWWRYAVEGASPQAAVDAPRWLLGRTWGDESSTLKLEKSLADEIGADLEARGHGPTTVADRDEIMGHAGMVVLHDDGRAEAGCDVRSDGAARHGVSPSS